MPESDETGQNDERDNLRQLREAADAGKQAKADAEAARRELAFVKAGVDTDTKLGQLLLKTYEGELTTEAIRAEATELGAFKETSSTKDPEITEEERAQTRERRDLAAEGGPAGTETAHPNELAYAAFDAALKKGDTRETAAGAAFAEILKAAHRGDQRVILP